MDAYRGFDARLTGAGDVARTEQRSVGGAPEFQAVAKLRAMLLVEPSDHDLDDDLRLGPAAFREVAATVKIVLVNCLCPGQPVGPDGQLDRFENRRFSGVVVAQEDRSPIEMKICEANASEVFDVNSNDSQFRPRFE